MWTRLTFAAALASPLAALTRKPAQIEIEGHLLGPSLLLRVSGEPAAIQRLSRAVAGAGGSVEALEEASGPTFLAHGDFPERGLVQAIERAGGIVVPPLRWASGEVRIDALAPETALATAVRREVPEARLARKVPSERGQRPDEMLRGSLVLPGLTRKQAEAILAALDAGYYDLPRKVTTLDVAKGRGVARSTFEEHLKRAEAQFIAALAPLARLQLAQAGAARAEAIQLYARFSHALGVYVTMAVAGDRVRRVSLAAEAPKDARSETHPYLARILDHAATGQDDLADIPLDLEVTPFERQVLDAMRAIPAGEVRTYGELARAIGKPGAARAVGNACGANPAVIVVPCHRVVPSDGTLGNYSGEGGARTKAKLLQAEGAKPLAPAKKGARKARPAQ